MLKKVARTRSLDALKSSNDPTTHPRVVVDFDLDRMSEMAT